MVFQVCSLDSPGEFCILVSHKFLHMSGIVEFQPQMIWFLCIEIVLCSAFLLLVILTNTPFVFDTVYFKSFFFVFPILLIGYLIDSFAFSSLFNNKSPQSSILVVTLLFSLILLPSCIDFDDEGDLLLFNRNSETKNFSDMRNDDYDTAQSMNYNFEGIHIATNKEKVLAAYSGGQTLFDWNTDMFIHTLYT